MLKLTIPALLPPALLCIALLSTGCSQSALTAPNISKFGPHQIHAGVIFNKQPNGMAALWVLSANRLAGNAVIVLDGQKLATHSKGDLATAMVPPALYEKAGSYPLQIVENANGQQLQSNTVNFVVSPN